MDKVSLPDLELAEFWQEDNEDMEVAANFPFTPSFPATAGLEAENHTVVYGEIEPGKELATHTEDADELLVVLGGTAEVSLGTIKRRSPMVNSSSFPLQNPTAFATSATRLSSTSVCSPTPT